MRAYAIVATLVGSIGAVGCSTDVNMGGTIKPADTLFAFDAGGACSQGADCVSGFCLGGACCALTTCGSDTNCQGTRCDETGACVYPTVSCGTPSCNASTQQLTTSACDQGTCVAGTPSNCPDHLTCANGTACQISCVLSNDCISGFYCSAGSCLAQLAAGSVCTSSESCATGVCGVAGSGHCCTATCVSGDAYGCGGTDCDTAGACVYPPVTASCVTQSCTGHELTEPASCNGAGVCAVPTPATADCTPYLCGSNGACRTGCSGATDCWNGFCSSASSRCCSFYSSSTIQVDGTQGVDQACCGSAPGAGACATIAYAAALAVDTGDMPMTLAVANPPNGKDWIADQYPITLGQGLVLSAPGLFFSAVGLDAGPWELLLVFNEASVINPLPTVVEGSASAPIHLGFDSQGNQTPSSDPAPGQFENHSDVIDVDHAVLNLLHAEIRSIRTGIRVGGEPAAGCDAGCPSFQDATLTLGNDGLGQSGTVWINAPDGGGEFAILCEAPGGLVSDTGSTVAPSLWAQGPSQGIGVTYGCGLSLTMSPLFGPAPNDAGACESLPNGLGILYNSFVPAGPKGSRQQRQIPVPGPSVDRIRKFQRRQRPLRAQHRRSSALPAGPGCSRGRWPSHPHKQHVPKQPHRNRGLWRGRSQRRKQDHLQ